MDSVQRLVKKLSKAIEAGDEERALGLFETVEAVMAGKAEGYTAADSLEAVRCLSETFPDFAQKMRETLLRWPDITVEAVKTLREIVANPDTPEKVRAEARQLLEKHGYDDESLASEEID